MSTTRCASGTEFWIKAWVEKAIVGAGDDHISFPALIALKRKDIWIMFFGKKDKDVRLTAKEFNAYEVEHVQKIVQSHYWIFGEQYNLISAAEPDFEQALQGLLKTSGKKDKKLRIEHEDKNKEMDIFMIKQDRRGNVIENVVVELKRPSVKLGEKQLSQVKQYMRVIKSEDRFNSGDSKWTYYLVGNEFDTSGYIEGELENCRSKGDKHLVYETNSGLTRIYVLKWSELFDELLTRHEYLMDKLKFEEELWIKKHNSADETVEDLSDNSAQMKPAVV